MNSTESYKSSVNKQIHAAFNEVKFLYEEANKKPSLVNFYEINKKIELMLEIFRRTREPADLQLVQISVRQLIKINSEPLDVCNYVFYMNSASKWLLGTASDRVAKLSAIIDHLSACNSEELPYEKLLSIHAEVHEKLGALSAIFQEADAELTQADESKRKSCIEKFEVLKNEILKRDAISLELLLFEKELP